MINNEYANNSKIITNKFNEYFVKFGPNLASHIIDPEQKSFKDYLTTPTLVDFQFELVNENLAIKIIDNLKPKTSCGVDSLAIKFLKYVKNAISRILTLIINQSFTTGIFPDKLKIAKIVPLYKQDENLKKIIGQFLSFPVCLK